MVKKISSSDDSSWVSASEQARKDIEKLIQRERVEDNYQEVSDLHDKMWSQVQKNFKLYVEDLKRHTNGE